MPLGLLGWFSCQGGKQLWAYFAPLSTENVMKNPLFYMLGVLGLTQLP